jgi:hypothetical protein
MIPVDTCGIIELTEKEVADMTTGQVPLLQGKPDSMEAADERKRKSQNAAQEAATRAEFEQWRKAKKEGNA